MKFIVRFIILFMLVFLLIGCSESYEEGNVTAQIVVDSGVDIAIGEISNVKDLKWKSTITADDFHRAVSNKYDSAAQLAHVTSEDGVTFKSLGVGELLPTTNGYIEIPLHFRSNHAEGITLDQVSLNATVTLNTASVTFTTSKGTVINGGSDFSVSFADCIRLSFEANNNVLVYENPESQTNTVLGGKDQEDISNLYGAASYYEAVTETEVYGIHQVTVPQTVTSLGSMLVLSMDEVDSNVYGALFYGVLTLRIWVEGYDPEAYNHALDDLLTLELRFSGTSN